MKHQTRRKFSAEFKAKVVIEALKERQTIEELARKYELHPTQISLWKKEFLENASSVFKTTDQSKDDEKKQSQHTELLYAQIGQLQVQNNWLKKKLEE